MKAFKNHEQSLFHLKRSIRSEDVYVFALTFLIVQENGLTREVQVKLQNL